ncbi:hypothetical protein LY90DRAFT_709953 [Neocallimastix californiae]|uniref:Uncharacterized protein n=1 Tax=Neocallimastix californiae TaxID=1754190 RepID=A0A1Y1XZK4_9FUNG|nr:hypothetical protein LY90DRAFT_709953 [Neocallimastix californiae]|eukprot:ORX91095.1 hypothetical protein LY90DRAFT_709953 [Neocallimastix californiae]
MESGTTTQSVTETSEISENSESKRTSKYNGINNDTTLKDPSNSNLVNRESNDEIPTLTNNKDTDITENDIDTMNSMEKLQYIENSYDRFMSNTLPSVEYNNKEEYTNQNSNVKITEDLNEYSLQDESSLFDDALKIKILIFGTRDSWYIQYEDGKESWNNIPTFLQWRLEIQRKIYPNIPVTWLSMSNDGWCWFVRFADEDVTISGRKEWVIRRNMIINNNYDNKNHMKSYSIQRNGYYTWSNGLSSFLQDNLIHRNKNIKNIVLCSGTKKSYFLQYNNYHSAFQPYLNPFTVRFTTSTVSVHIKTDTNVRDLVRGVRNKSISFNQLPELRVIQDPRDGRWWAIDNYWLWVLKEAGIRRVTVKIFPWTKEFLRGVRGKWDVTVLNEDYKPYDY